jgi:hypothetical protein
MRPFFLSQITPSRPSGELCYDKQQVETMTFPGSLSDKTPCAWSYEFYMAGWTLRGTSGTEKLYLAGPPVPASISWIQTTDRRIIPQKLCYKDCIGANPMLERAEEELFRYSVSLVTQL